jgi:hypothetical protein
MHRARVHILRGGRIDKDPENLNLANWLFLEQVVIVEPIHSKVSNVWGRKDNDNKTSDIELARFVY